MSCDDVCVDMCCDYTSEFSTSVMRRAAKPYRCCECRREIVRGETYEASAGKCEGDFWYEKTCAECAEIRKAFVCGGYVISQLWEEIGYQLFPTWHDMKTIDCVAQLSDAAGEKIRAKYAEWAKDNPVAATKEGR